MATVLSRRLGKRSLLGTRVTAPDGILVASQISELGRAPAPHEDGSCSRALEESGRAATFPNPGLRQLRGQQVLLTPLDEPSQAFPACWRVPDTLQPPSLPNSMDPGPTEALQRAVSSSIDVPKRKADAAVEMDEMVAAMVLTSLSCSPAVQSPPCGDPPPRAACEAWKESGDVSDSGSSSSGRGSAGSAAPSPPRPSGTARGSPDHGFDTDCEPFPRDEPAPRRRKNSVVLRCLWPGCGKELRSVVGIKRHVRTRHLRDGPDSEHRKQEEDFYYTEVQVKEEPPAEVPPASATSPGATSPGTTSPGATSPGATSPASCSAPIVIRPALGTAEAALAPPEPGPRPPALSHSAPGSFWHIQADHAYQALPSIQIPVSPHIFTSISWAAATSPLPSLSPVRSRSLSLSEPQAPPPPPLLQPQLLVASPPRVSLSTRKGRGEAKKCRKVYGVEHRDQWCTACRWKKACQRFLD